MRAATAKRLLHKAAHAAARRPRPHGAPRLRRRGAQQPENLAPKRQRCGHGQLCAGLQAPAKQRFHRSCGKGRGVCGGGVGGGGMGKWACPWLSA